MDTSDFDGIGEAEIFERGNYLNPGSYALKVKTVLLKKTRKSGAGFIVEFEVIHSHGDKANAVGSKATWFQKMSDKDVALPSIKEFMLSLLDIDKNDKEDMAKFNAGLQQILVQATEYKGKEEDHPLYGQTIRVDCYMKKTLKGNDFTAHMWQSWTEEDGWEVE